MRRQFDFELLAFFVGVVGVIALAILLVLHVRRTHAATQEAAERCESHGGRMLGFDCDDNDSCRVSCTTGATIIEVAK